MKRIPIVDGEPHIRIFIETNLTAEGCDRAILSDAIEKEIGVLGFKGKY